MKFLPLLAAIFMAIFSSVIYGNILGDSVSIQSNNIRCLAVHIVRPKAPANLEVMVDDVTAQKIGTFNKNHVGHLIATYLYANGNFLLIPISPQQVEAMSKDKELINLSTIQTPWQSNHFQLTIGADKISYVETIIKKHQYTICK